MAAMTNNPLGIEPDASKLCDTAEPNKPSVSASVDLEAMADAVHTRSGEYTVTFKLSATGLWSSCLSCLGKMGMHVRGIGWHASWSTYLAAISRQIFNPAFSLGIQHSRLEFSSESELLNADP